MKKLLLLAFFFLIWSADSYAQSFHRLLEEDYILETPEINLFQPQAADLHYQYRISGKKTFASMNIGFKNCSSWQHLRLPTEELRATVANAITTVGDSITKNFNITISLRKTSTLTSWMVEYNIRTEPIIFVSDLKGHSNTAKLDYDTLNILVSGGDSNQNTIFYQIIGYDLHSINATFWENIDAANQKIDTQMQEMAIKKKSDAFHNQITGHLIWNQENGYTLVSRRNILSNAIRNTVFIDVSFGPYFGMGNISTNFDAVIGFYVTRDYANYRPFVGINSGGLNTNITSNGITSDNYLGIEIGGVKSKGLPSFLSGPRTSLVLGVYNTYQEKGIFSNKPQIYLGIKFPLWTHIQFTMHVSSSFKTKNIDYSKYLLGISTNICIGSLFD